MAKKSIKKKESMTIAVIDDGIENEGSLYFDLEVIGEHITQRKTKKRTKELTHGTMCYKVLREYSDDCNIGSIKIMGINNKENALDALLIAIKWCIANCIDIIHISLGICSVNPYSRLRERLAEFFVQGGLIIAAIDNTEKYTLPAAFSFVFAVRRNDMLEQGMVELSYSEKYGKSIIEIGTIQMLKKYEEIKMIKCNSYTTPVFTAKILQLIGKHQNNFYRIKKVFCANKENVYRPDFVQNVIVVGEREIMDQYFFFQQLHM